MQADRHHLRRALAFGIEHVEGILQIGEELVAAVEALRRGEAHVVGVERIGHDELRTARPVHPIGQLVGVGIGGIEKAALLHGERQRILRRAALIHAERARAGHLRVDANGLLDVAALVGGAEILVLDPLEPVGGDSQPASFIAATASGLRASAVATPNTVTGMLRSANRRCTAARSRRASRIRRSTPCSCGAGRARPPRRRSRTGTPRTPRRHGECCSRRPLRS